MIISKKSKKNNKGLPTFEEIRQLPQDIKQKLFKKAEEYMITGNYIGKVPKELTELENFYIDYYLTLFNEI